MPAGSGRGVSMVLWSVNVISTSQVRIDGTLYSQPVGPSARLVLADASSALLARVDEQEALLRLSLGDLRSPAKLTGRLPVVRRELLLARIALAADDQPAAREHLSAVGVTSRSQALERAVNLCLL